MYADGLKPPSRMSVLVVTAVRPPSGFRCHVRALGWGPGVRLHWLMTWWKHDEGYPGFFATIPGMYTFLNRFLYSAFTLGSHSNHVFSVHTGYWFSTRSIHELVVHSFGVLNMTLRSQWEEPVGKRCQLAALPWCIGRIWSPTAIKWQFPIEQPIGKWWPMGLSENGAPTNPLVILLKWQFGDDIPPNRPFQFHQKRHLWGQQSCWLDLPAVQRLRRNMLIGWQGQKCRPCGGVTTGDKRRSSKTEHSLAALS